MNTQVMLFACSKCFSRHPFEELSPGQQLCKECRGAYPIVKCTFCRSEFQQSSKGSTSTICKKCEQSVKQYGKPSACELCCLLAAFIGNKCQRCTNSELKYGPAVTCQQCKQRSAFNRPDHKIDGKQLCWLCTKSYKRALAKARIVHQGGHHGGAPSKKRPSDDTSGGGGAASGQKVSKTSQGQMSSQHPKKHARHDHNNRKDGSVMEIPDKVVKGSQVVDPHSSDHVVAMTQLKETIASLQKRLAQKDRDLLQKEKEITELKGKHFTLENELRVKMKDQERIFQLKYELINKKVATQLKEIAQLTKLSKKNVATPTNGDAPSKDVNNGKETKTNDTNKENQLDEKRSKSRSKERSRSKTHSPSRSRSVSKSSQRSKSNSRSPSRSKSRSRSKSQRDSKSRSRDSSKDSKRSESRSHSRSSRSHSRSSNSDSE